MRSLIVGIFSLFILTCTVNLPTKGAKQYDEKELISRKLDVECDVTLDLMLTSSIEQGVKDKSTKGYRVQIYFGSGLGAKERAVEARTKFVELHPEVDIYLEYKAPDFKVRAGNFRTKSEALKLKKDIEAIYRDAFIVYDVIRFPEL